MWSNWLKKFGRNYNRSTCLRLLPTQLAWFAYVVCFLCRCIFGFLIAVVKLCVIHLLTERCAQLNLAIQGDSNLKNNGHHDIEIEKYKEDIMSERDRIAKIDLVLDGRAEEDVNEAF